MSNPSIHQDDLVKLDVFNVLTQGYVLVKHPDMSTYGVADPEGQVHIADDQGHAFGDPWEAKTFAITQRWMRLQP